MPLPDELSFVTGAAISCGTGTAYGALKRLNLQGGETIAIFGQGPVGLSATQLAVAMGARVIALDVAPERLRARQGVRRATRSSTRAPTIRSSAIRDLTHGEGAHKTLDARGAGGPRRGGARDAVLGHGLLRRRARSGHDRCQPRHAAPADDAGRVVDLLQQGQAECAEFVADRKVDVEKLFTHRWQLDQAEEAYKLFDTQTTGKGVILP